MTGFLTAFVWLTYRVEAVPSEDSLQWSLEFYQGKKFVARFELPAAFKPKLLKADLSGDGAEELVVESYTGGAHCCFVYWVFTAEPLKLAAQLETGSAQMELADLDGDGAAELVGMKLFEYLGDLPFAASPAIPVAYGLRGGNLVDLTPPEALEEFAAECLDSLKQAEDELNAKHLAACYYAAMARLGRAKQALREIRRVSPQLYRWIQDLKRELEPSQ